MNLDRSQGIGGQSFGRMLFVHMSQMCMKYENLRDPYWHCPLRPSRVARSNPIGSVSLDVELQLKPLCSNRTHDMGLHWDSFTLETKQDLCKKCSCSHLVPPCCTGRCLLVSWAGFILIPSLWLPSPSRWGIRFAAIPGTGTPNPTFS